LRESGSLEESAYSVTVEEVFETVPPSTDAPTRRRSGVRVAQRSFGMTESAISDLVARMRGTLAFYADRSGGQPVSRVLVSGGGAAVPGVVEALGASMPLPVEYLGVGRIASGKSMPQAVLDLDLVSTVGLALGEVR
jgi:Tfp pilus assembly PilM family ATPase